MYDYVNVMLQGNASLNWLSQCMDKKNHDKTIGSFLDDFQRERENLSLINGGVLLMTSYLFFVYPQEKFLEEVDLNIVDKLVFTEDISISLDGVNEHENRKPYKINGHFNKNLYILKRIRNSLAHGNFSLENTEIIFEDKFDKKSRVTFRIKCKYPDFGKFLMNFSESLKNKYLESKV